LPHTLQKENRWTTFKPPAAGQSSRYRGLTLHRRSHQMSGPFSLTEMSVILRRVPKAVWPRTIRDESIVLDEKRSNGSIRTAYAFAVVHHSGVKAMTRLRVTVRSLDSAEACCHLA